MESVFLHKNSYLKRVLSGHWCGWVLPPHFELYGLFVYWICVRKCFHDNIIILFGSCLYNSIEGVSPDSHYVNKRSLTFNGTRAMGAPIQELLVLKWSKLAWECLEMQKTCKIVCDGNCFRWPFVFMDLHKILNSPGMVPLQIVATREVKENFDPRLHVRISHGVASLPRISTSNTRSV